MDQRTEKNEEQENDKSLQFQKEFEKVQQAFLEEQRNNRTSETKDNKAFLALVGFINRQLKKNC